MTMNVTFFRDVTNRGPVAKDAMAVHNAVDISTSAQSNATPDAATFVKIVCTEAAYVAYGETAGKEPIASSSNGDYVPAGVPVWYSAQAGHRVAGKSV